LEAAGTNTSAVRRKAWFIGTSFACASGVLLAPLLAQLNVITLTFLVVTAFGAAALGAFTSMPITFLGGIAIAVGQQLCTKYFTTGFATGLSPALPFLVLLLAMLLFPRRWLVEESRVLPRIKRPSAPWQLNAIGSAVAIVLLVLVPQFDELHLTDWTTALSYVVLFLSLGLLVRTSGQVSLAHVSFMAIGACALSKLTVEHHVPWLVAVAIAGAISVPIGALLAVPAIRLSGLYLALATLGFGIMLQFMFYNDDLMFGSDGLGLTIPRPTLGGATPLNDRGYYFLILAITIAIALFVVGITRSRLGRLLTALSDSPTGLKASGASIDVTRVLVFCTSAFLAAVAGALQAGGVQNVTGDSYNPFQSLIMFALVVVSIGRVPWYALMAAGALIIVPILPPFSGPDTAVWLQLLFGIGAVLYAASERWAPSSRTPLSAVSADENPHADTSWLAAGGAELQVAGLTVTFGGAKAVNDVTFDVTPGRVTGLIGPNGAGKTTTFNACTGLVPLAAGTVRLNGDRIESMRPAGRARRGISRTFQHTELFDSMSVLDNVRMGVEAGKANRMPWNHLVSTRRQRKQIDATAHAAIARCQITHLAGTTAANLSTGQRRLVELARCLAGAPRVLLLDEPAAGLDRTESAAFGRIVADLATNSGLSVLLVEHDMALVAEICDYLYVLDFGELITHGPASSVLASPIVRSVYLGETAVFTNGVTA
jgi:ABC-type branched-subunit amino acid transport system ATPase component/ABC-type branched-subunit amino acid transport system permease subunit